jgi:hypothetical protein
VQSSSRLDNLKKKKIQLAFYKKASWPKFSYII